MNTMQLKLMRNSELGIRNWAHSALRTPHFALRILLIGLWTLVTPTHALEVRTLGGGPNERSLSKAGFADGNTLLIAKFNNPSDIAIDTAGLLNFAMSRV